MIAQAIEKLIFNRVAPRQIRHIQPVDYDSATGLAAEVYQHMRRELQLFPPVTLHSPVPESPWKAESPHSEEMEGCGAGMILLTSKYHTSLPTQKNPGRP